MRREAVLAILLVVASACRAAINPAPIERNDVHIGSASQTGRETEVAKVRAWQASQRIDGLCHPDEEILFQCKISQGRLALCSGKSHSIDSYIQFRQSVGSAVNVFPMSQRASVERFTPGFGPRSSGGESYISFSIDGVPHRLFSIMAGVRPDVKAGDYEITDGMIVGSAKNAKEVFCTGQAEVPVNLDLLRKIKRM